MGATLEVGARGSVLLKWDEFYKETAFASTLDEGGICIC